MKPVDPNRAHGCRQPSFRWRPEHTNRGAAGNACSVQHENLAAQDVLLWPPEQKRSITLRMNYRRHVIDVSQVSQCWRLLLVG